jgi:hypothetical protein
VQKFFAWACLNAALIGSIGLSYADGYNDISDNVANDIDGDVKFETVLDEVSQAEACQTEASQNDSSVELASYSRRSGYGSGPSLGNWLDNTVVFTGADIYKSVGDRVTNIAGGPGALSSSYGAVTGFNTGFALGDSGLRGQVGGSYGVYDFRGRLAIVPDSTNVEEQGFFTAGVTKRGDMASDSDPLSYGVVLDAFASDNWGVNANKVDVGQVRGMMGYALSERFEIGGFGTGDLWDDGAAVTVAGAPGVRRTVRAAKQFNSYIRGNTLAGGSLMGYAGVFDSADIQCWQFGTTGEAPLSEWFSLYGNCNYAVPSSSAGAGGSGEEQFNIQFGLCYFFGGKAASPSVTGQQGLPLFDVANNSSFLITD